jgi:hypothetical protein
LCASHTVEVLEHLRRTRRHPEEALRANQGIRRLARDFSPEQLEAAARRALDLKVYSYRALRALITKKAAAPAEPASTNPDHENVRGSGYFR